MKASGVIQILLSLAGAILIFQGFDPSRAVNPVEAVTPSDSVSTYEQQILPLLRSNCTPCHFPGGTVYDRHPFDNYQTVFGLRKRLNTRLKDKDEQALVNQWIKTGAKRSNLISKFSVDFPALFR